MTLGLICARAGSEGLPGKNVRPLLGIPLIEHAVATALESQCDEIAVCTDIPRSVWSMSGVHRIERPPSLAGPRVPKLDVWRYCAGVAESDICDIDVTRPLRTAADIDACLDTFDAIGGAVMAVARARKAPAFDYLTGTLPMLDAPTRYANRQEVPPAYQHGGVYVFSRAELERRTHIFDGPVYCHEIPEGNAWDIDDEIGFRIVDMLMRDRLNV